MATDSSGIKTVPSEEVLAMWRGAKAVCFDVDSTVCVDEGIDELAAYLGAGEAVAAWTAKAMGGNVPFQDALSARLELMTPSRDSVDGFLKANPPRLSKGIDTLVSTLQSRGTDVYLVSGGFRQMIGPVADLLGVPRSNIYANNILFSDSDGAYAGFDKEEFTSRSGGKANAIMHLKKQHGYHPMVMVGDGATDLEARTDGGAEIFIGYGGIQVRDKVALGADWFVYSFEPLIDALK